uniref:Uncharacterized protein n=1 Tax=Strigamia maritima TaxID=126957 RepID=T1JF13_STRMM
MKNSEYIKADMNFLAKMHFFVEIILFSIFYLQGVESRPNIVDFEDVARDYVENIAREYNRKVSWWDLYGKHQHLAERPQYKRYKIDVSTDIVKYGVSTRTIDRPGYVYSQWFHNSQSDQAIQGQMSKKVERSTSFTWSLKEGLKIGVEIGASVGVPGEFGASVSVGVELSLE